jgi:uncharacterized protein (TIGR00369 family)
MTAPDQDHDAVIRRAIATMPALHALGIEVVELSPGHAEVRLPERADLTQHDGYVQGGLVGTLADVAGGCATATLLPPGRVGMTADYTVKLLAPARGTLTGRGRVISARRSTSVAAADVLDADGTVCATALVTMRNVDTGR